jgi:type II secretory pathway pseudopilin PulG
MDPMSAETPGQASSNSHRSTYGGFSLLETVVAIAVLAFGVLSLAAVLANGLAFMSMTQEDFIAQQKATEAVESVFTARDTKVVTWAQIENVVNGGIFLNGPQPLLDPGPDGMVNTADDVAANPDVIVGPGPDGILGTADDQIIPLSNFTREIKITDYPGNPNLKQIQVIMRYTAGRFRRTYTLTTYISSFS